MFCGWGMLGILREKPAWVLGRDLHWSCGEGPGRDPGGKSRV